MPVRVLLDNNVWRRVADDGVAQVLRRRSKEAGAAVLVAPAVVYEMLRTPNPATRDRLIKTVTLGSWTRLRTEVYYACAEVRNLVTRHRRHWLIEHPDLRSYYRLEADWGPGGWFWRRARGDTAAEARRVLSLEGDRLEQARAEAKERRSHMMSLQFDSIKQVAGWTAAPPVAIPGWDGSNVEVWRFDAADWWWRAITRREVAPVVDWLHPWIDSAAIATQPDSWGRMWLHEADAAEVPREWIRWAVRFLQGTRGVTAGTPVDNQIASYLYDADLFVSGDKTFVDIIRKVQPEAPATVADAHRLRREEDVVDRIIDLVA